MRRLEKEQRRVTDQLEEERAQHKQLSCALAKECKWASARALEEGHRLTEAGRKLDKVAAVFRYSLRGPTEPSVGRFYWLLLALARITIRHFVDYKDNKFLLSRETVKDFQHRSCAECHCTVCPLDGVLALFNPISAKYRKWHRPPKKKNPYQLSANSFILPMSPFTF